MSTSENGTALWSLSQVYWDHAKFDLAQGRPQQAQRNYEKADELISELVRANSGAPQQLIHTVRQAQVRASLGRYDDAEGMFSRVLEIRRGNRNEAQNLPITLSSLGWVRIHQRNFSQAEVVLREACDLFGQGEQRSNCDSLLGASLVGQGKFQEAEPLLILGYDGLLQATVDERSVTNAAYRLTTSRFVSQDAGAWIVRLYEEWGKPVQAAQWRGKLQANKAGPAQGPLP